MSRLGTIGLNPVVSLTRTRTSINLVTKSICKYNVKIALIRKQGFISFMYFLFNHFRLFELFKTTDVLLGNDPIAANVVQMMGGLRKLELIDILTMMQFKTSMNEVFEDWNPIQQYMKEKLNLNQETIAVISKAELNIPGVRKTKRIVIMKHETLYNFKKGIF